MNLKNLFEYTKSGRTKNLPQEVIQATDIALRQSPSETLYVESEYSVFIRDFNIHLILSRSRIHICCFYFIGRTSVGRSFFKAPGPREIPADLTGGLVLWHGHYQSAVMAWKPYLNVDGNII